MSSRTELIALCRDALSDDAPVDYFWSDDNIATLINRVLRQIYPKMYRLVTNNEIRLRYDTPTYDLSTLHPPVDGLIGVYIVTTQGDYFVRRHYDWDKSAKLLTFTAGFFQSLLRDTASTQRTGERLVPVYRSHFTPLVDANQECELAEPDEELIVRGVEELALRKLRNWMIHGREHLPTETWNEFERVIDSARKHYDRLLDSKQMVRHGGYPSTRRRRMRSGRVRTGAHYGYGWRW